MALRRTTARQEEALALLATAGCWFAKRPGLRAKATVKMIENGISVLCWALAMPDGDDFEEFLTQLGRLSKREGFGDGWRPRQAPGGDRQE